MEQVRAFIAIELPDEVRAELGRLQARLKSGGSAGVKWVDPHSIHLTLQFLGSVDVDMLPEISRAIEEACRGVSSFRLKVKGVGAFPNLRLVQVVWVGVSGEFDRLSHLQKRLESNLARLGFAPESRPFTPHLTLARVRQQAGLDERQRLGQMIAGTGFEVAGDIKVETISLMRSELTGAGPIYSRIGSVSLDEIV